MLGILYLILSSWVGWHLVTAFLPRLANVLETDSLTGPPAHRMKRWLMMLPASFLTGTLLMTWLTYIAAAGFAFTGKAMLIGNIVSFTVFGLITAWTVFRRRQQIIPAFETLRRPRDWPIKPFILANRTDLIYAIGVALLSWGMMAITLQEHSGMLNVGGWVYSDFSPHLAIIRSFSVGYNFPTEYPHYANGVMQYHFIFHFLAGNLEYLGLNLADAFNLPTMLSLTSFLMLFYVFSFILTGKRAVGYLATVLMMLRSSFAYFIYLADTFFTNPKTVGFSQLGEILGGIYNSHSWVGKTTYESWGLWALPSIFVNQRHNNFAMGIMMLALIFVIPLFLRMVQACNPIDKTIKRSPMDQLKLCWATAESWMPVNPWQAAFIGLLLGLTSFLNGAIVLGALILLFFLALASRNRLEFLIIAVIALALTFAETQFFMGANTHKVFNPVPYVGLFAAEKTLPGITTYFLQVFGILPFVLLLAVFFMPRGSRWLAVCFLMPLVIATLLKFSTDIMNNHKFVHITIILANILVANFLVFLFTRRSLVKTALAVFLTLMLTITGVVDAFTFINGNKNFLSYNLADPVLVWLRYNTDPNKRFLTPNYSLNAFLLAGRKLFLGWQYFPWAAGYNTPNRDNIVVQIYGGTDIEAIKTLLVMNKISYVVIDGQVRHATSYQLHEELFRRAFKVIYDDPGSSITIYKVD